MIPRRCSGKNPPASAGDTRDAGLIPGSEDPVRKEMATHSSILAWTILWTAEPDGLQSTGSRKSRTGLSSHAPTAMITFAHGNLSARKALPGICSRPTLTLTLPHSAAGPFSRQIVLGGPSFNVPRPLGHIPIACDGCSPQCRVGLSL